MCGQWVGSSIISAPAATARSASWADSSGLKPARLAMTRAPPSLARLMPSPNESSVLRSEPNTALSIPGPACTKRGSTSGAGRETMVLVHTAATPERATSAMVSPSRPCTPAATTMGLRNSRPQKLVFRSTSGFDAILPPQPAGLLLAGQAGLLLVDRGHDSFLHHQTAVHQYALHVPAAEAHGEPGEHRGGGDGGRGGRPQDQQGGPLAGGQP